MSPKKSNPVVLLILSALLGVPAGALVIFTAIAIDVLKIHSALPITLSAMIISFLVITGIWYLFSKRLYAGDKKILYLSFLVLIIVSFASTNFALDFAAIGPKGEQIPMYALIFRGYEIDGTKVVYTPWEKYDWQFYEPHGYQEKFSRKYEDRIYIASFYYREQQRAQEAFIEYRASLISQGFNKSNFDVKVNDTERFGLIDSFAFENNDFIYGELIGTKESYLPGNFYIIVIKSNINEKQTVEAMVR